MNRRPLQTGFVVALLCAQGALAQSPAQVEIYKRHFAQLAKSHQHHMRFLMDDGARALRVFDKYGFLEKESPASSQDQKEDKTGGQDKKKATPKFDEKATRQILTAATELESVATALQRPPLPPDGFWLKTAQHLKQPAARLARLTLNPESPALAPLVAQARDACYECHRTYGGPLAAAELVASGPVDYEQPYPLPPTAGSAKALRGKR